MQVQRDPDLGVGDEVTKHVDGAAVRDENVVRRREGVTTARPPGRVLPGAVPHPPDDPGLVVRDPALHTVSEPPGDGGGVVGKRLDDPAVGPAAAILERDRKIPVIERDARLDSRGEQRIDEAVVEVEPFLVDRADAVRDHAWPGDREAEALDPEVLHQADVVEVAVVEVDRDRAVVAVQHLAGRRAEAIPDRLSASADRRLRLRSGTTRSPRPR